VSEPTQSWREEQPSAEIGPPADPTASRRTFSQGVGFIMQGIGATLFMLTTCACCGLAFWEGDAMHRGFADTTGSARNDAAPLLLLTTVLGSLALVAFGLGQQSDRGRVPAVGSAVTTSSMTVLYGLVVLLASDGAHTGGGWPAVAAAVLMLIMFLCSMLTWAAASQVLRYPPLSSDAPTVPAAAFPDPLAQPRRKHDSPAVGDIARQRKRLEEELHSLDDLERQVRRQNRSDS